MHWGSTTMPRAWVPIHLTHHGSPSSSGSTWKTPTKPISCQCSKTKAMFVWILSYRKAGNRWEQLRSVDRRVSDSYFHPMDRLVIHQIFRNRSKTTRPTFINLPRERWTHLAWTYSNQSQQSYFYLDGARQQAIDFGAMSLDFESK